MPPEGVPYMDIAEFRKLGLVQEINRIVLHPLGLALEVTTLDGRVGWKPDDEPTVAAQAPHDSSPGAP